MTPAVDWGWDFNGAEDGTGVVYAGFWEHTDEDPVSEYTLSFVAGADGSTYAISGQDPNSDAWGGGVALYLSCLDASAYTGVQFMFKGSTPNGTYGVSIVAEGDVAFSTADLTVPEDWTLVQLAWSDFTPDEGSAALTGSQMGSLTFNAHLVWMPDPNDATGATWIPEPGPFEITVDDISFY